MKEFFLIVNEAKDPGLAITKRLEDYLLSQGATCSHATLSSLQGGRSAAESFPAHCGVCIVLGGDGTMLEATHCLKDQAMPLIGVNLGNIGYLTETGEQDAEKALDKLLADAYTIEARMMLEGEITCENNADGRPLHTALNDIVIARYGSIGMIRLNVRVNGQPLCDYHADGLILATPTGSTGYNMSAGGPVVEPVARLILMTPVAPHALSSRSIILSPEDEVTVSVHPTHPGEEVEAEISFDAAKRVKIKGGDSITIRRAKRITNIVRLEQASFLDILHNKMG